MASESKDHPDCLYCGQPYDAHYWNGLKGGGLAYKDYGMCYAKAPYGRYVPKPNPDNPDDHQADHR
jgi:hypothetical protein